MTYRYPGLKPKISAAEINRWNDAANAKFNGANVGRDSLSSQSHWVFIRNDSGTDASRFETMKLGDPIFDLETDGSVDLMFKADTASPGEQACVLTEDIPNGEYGRAIIYGMALALVEAGTGTFAEPSAANRLTPVSSGTIKIITPTDAGTEKLCAVLLGVGAAGGDNHYLFGTTSTFSGSATANITDLAGTPIETASVIGTLGDFDGIPAGASGICFRQDNVYYAIRVFQQHVTDVRWVDPDLEKTRDNAQSWDNVDTAEDCP